MKSSTDIDAAYCYRRNSMVCLSVSLSDYHSREPCCLGCGLGRPKEPCIRWVQTPMCRDGFELLRGRKGWPIVKYMDSAVSCVKTAESVDMPFVLWTLVSPRQHVLDGRTH